MKKLGIVTLVAVVALLVAWRAGSVTAAPRTKARPRENAPSTYEASFRLVESANDAHVDAPHAAASLALLAAHGRKTKPAYLASPSKWVTNIALRADVEDGFDHREALVAAGPSSFTFRVMVPGAARLSFAQGTLTREPATFIVRAGGQEIWRNRPPQTAAGKWSDAACDLSAFAGRTIDLELVVETGSAPSLALWGNPVVLTKATPRLPYNVLFVTADKIPLGRGARFDHAISAGLTSRIGILSLLAGARASELGLDPDRLAVYPAEAARFHASRPSLLPLLARSQGAGAHAVVRDPNLMPYSGAEVDLGFETVAHHATKAGDEAVRFLREHKDTRFFLFVEAQTLETTNALTAALDETGLRDRTLVVFAGANGDSPTPLLFTGPGVPEAEVKTRVRSTDVAPTVLGMLGLERDPRMSGRSLLPLARGTPEPDERVALAEGGGARILLTGHHRFVVRKSPPREELYDLDVDPTKDVAPGAPALLPEMRARLAAAQRNVPVAGTAAARAAEDDHPRVLLRFAGAGAVRRVSGTVTMKGKTAAAVPVGLGPEAVHVSGNKVDLAFSTMPNAIVGVDLGGDPAGWDLYLDDSPWPEDAVFAGPFGLLAPGLRHGAVTEEARASSVPAIDPRTDLGVFVVREMTSR